MRAQGGGGNSDTKFGGAYVDSIDAIYRSHDAGAEVQHCYRQTRVNDNHRTESRIRLSRTHTNIHTFIHKNSYRLVASQELFKCHQAGNKPTRWPLSKAAK